MVRNLFKGGNYSRAETICGNTVFENMVPSNKSVLPKAELVEVLRCSAFTSVMRSKIPAKIMVYKTPTNEIHKTIQVGTKMISQGQLIILEKNKYVLNAMVPRVLALIQKRGKCC